MYDARRQRRLEPQHPSVNVRDHVLWGRKGCASLAFHSADLSDQWILLGGTWEEATRNVYAMKVFFLGPFLFGQPTLCDQVSFSRVCESVPSFGGSVL